MLCATKVVGVRVVGISKLLGQNAIWMLVSWSNTHILSWKNHKKIKIVLIFTLNNTLGVGVF